MRIAISALLVLLLASAFASDDEAAELLREIPKAAWEPIFFEPINQVTRKIGWKSLREAALPRDSMEIRIWIGFGLSPLKGYSLRRDGSQWTGHYVVEDLQQTNSITVLDITPKDGWDKLWTQLVKYDLLTLPDASTLPDERMVLDGTCYVIEINRDDYYRTYEYSNPQDQKWPEAKKILSIIQTCRDEFGKE